LALGGPTTLVGEVFSQGTHARCRILRALVGES